MKLDDSKYENGWQCSHLEIPIILNFIQIIFIFVNVFQLGLQKFLKIYNYYLGYNTKVYLNLRCNFLSLVRGF